MSGEPITRECRETPGAAAPHYRPRAWRKSSDIEVAGFRQILVWPLVLRLDGDETESSDRIHAAIGETVASLAPPWEPVADLLDHLAAPHCTQADAAAGYEELQDAAQSYSEFVYFYDFLQQSLFHPPRDPGDDLPLRLWRRTDVGAAEFVLGHWSGYRRYSARVERFNLYLFSAGAAVAVAELDFDRRVGHSERFAPHTRTDWDDRPMTLADAQLALDQVRRAYTPYFDVETGPGRHPPQPRGVPLAFTWLDRNGVPLYDPILDREREDRLEPFGGDHHAAPPWTPDPLVACRKRYSNDDPDREKRRTAPLADHWRQILKPLVFAGYAPDVDRPPGEAAPKAVWRHIVDERIPLMSWISLTGAAAEPSGLDDAVATDPRDDLWLVSRGDWVRLCCADEPGTDPLPYSAHFLADFEKDSCYDRFFPSEASTSATRYMFSGYHFCVVGSSAGFFDKLIVHHFRRHYFQMALLLNMELAALLATSSRITNAVARLERRPRKPGDLAVQRTAFRRELIAIQEDFLSFVHRFRFTDVSNQIQPSELYRMWRKSMRLDGLYDDVKDELTAAVAFAQADEQVETGRNGARLSVIATLGLPLGLAFSAMALFGKVLETTDRFAPSGGGPSNWFGSVLWVGLPTLLVSAFFMLATSWGLQSVFGPPRTRDAHPTIAQRLGVYAVIALVAAGCVFLVLHGSLGF